LIIITFLKSIKLENSFKNYKKALTIKFICDILLTYKNKGIKMENIKKEFYIKALVDVYKDNYTDGELDWVNYYKIDTFISATTLNEAIKEFFNNNLYFKVDLEYLDYDVENNCFYYSVLCDNDNIDSHKTAQM
jgi:hypothetical protein